jgi:tartrate dehydratase alpha subunit/fumarate hydratase class I-like protein
MRDSVGRSRWRGRPEYPRPVSTAASVATSTGPEFRYSDPLPNVNISAGGVLPMCQDTGTAIVMGKKSEGVLAGADDADDAEAISQGVYDAYTKLALRDSQLAPLTMWEERNTGANLPAQIELYSTAQGEKGPEYKFLFIAKGGGSANKSFLFQETKAVLGNDFFSKSSGAVTVPITGLRVRSGE